MANRLVGNVYIIDSATANIALPWPSNGTITAVAFWAANTTGLFELTGSNTTDVIVKMNGYEQFGQTQQVHWDELRLSEAKVPTVTAGTAWIYFK